MTKWILRINTITHGNKFNLSQTALKWVYLKLLRTGQYYIGQKQITMNCAKVQGHNFVQNSGSDQASFSVLKRESSGVPLAPQVGSEAEPQQLTLFGKLCIENTGLGVIC